MAESPYGPFNLQATGESNVRIIKYASSRSHSGEVSSSEEIWKARKLSD